MSVYLPNESDGHNIDETSCKWMETPTIINNLVYDRETNVDSLSLSSSDFG